MFMGMTGADRPGSGFGNRRVAMLVERADYWTGTAVPADFEADTAIPACDGIAAGTLIATDRGWKRAQDLQPGDPVVTFDNGLVPLRSVSHSTLATRGRGIPRSAWPLDVPAGALGNRRDLRLLPGQAVLIESDRAEELYGDPFVLIPAAALVGWKGIARARPAPETAVVFLEFDGDEIVYAEGMALIHCGRRTPVQVATAEELMRVGQDCPYRVLPPALGRALLEAAPAG